MQRDSRINFMIFDEVILDDLDEELNIIRGTDEEE